MVQWEQSIKQPELQIPPLHSGGLPFSHLRRRLKVYSLETIKHKVFDLEDHRPTILKSESLKPECWGSRSFSELGSKNTNISVWCVTSKLIWGIWPVPEKRPKAADIRGSPRKWPSLITQGISLTWCTQAFQWSTLIKFGQTGITSHRAKNLCQLSSASDPLFFVVLELECINIFRLPVPF